MNTFTGVEVPNLTGGWSNAGKLFEGNKFACFALNILQPGIPDFLKRPLADFSNATSFLDTYLFSIIGKQKCWELGQNDQSLLIDSTGHTPN